MDIAHAVARSWLWQNGELLLLKTIGKPAQQENKQQAYAALLDNIDKRLASSWSLIVYQVLRVAPSYEGRFQAVEELLAYYGNKKVLVLAVDIYREPVNMAAGVLVVGPRHVGYVVPAYLLGPFVSARCDICGQPRNR